MGGPKSTINAGVKESATLNQTKRVCRSALAAVQTLRICIAIFTCLLACATSIAQTSSSKQSPDRRLQQLTKTIVAEAFDAIHDGWSSDEVILQDELHTSFINQCKTAIRDSKAKFADPQSISAADLSWTLMNLRKAGKLPSKTTRRKKVDLSAVRHVAEIATRSMLDKHQCSIDRIMCSPELRKEFNETATSIDESIDCYAVRKAAFQLRKARRLRPELITRIADWGRTVQTHSIKDIREDAEVLNEHPGVYIFSDSSGYLYIGQTANLRTRLLEHLDESHNRSLAKYLKSESIDSISIEVHDFDPKSKASKTMVRRAYESELIASRKPRFNVQP